MTKRYTFSLVFRGNLIIEINELLGLLLKLLVLITNHRLIIPLTESHHVFVVLEELKFMDLVTLGFDESHVLDHILSVLSVNRLSISQVCELWHNLTF